MYGNTRLTAVLGARPKDDDPKTLVAYGKALTDIGLPVLLIAPGGKVPLDMRTKKEREAMEAESTRPNTGGVHLATTDKALLKKYVERATKDPAARCVSGHPAPVSGHLNWAVRLGGSGYVVADADTPDEVAALRIFLSESYGGVEKVPGPTVITPGDADKAHHGGGHWWFKLPEGKVINPDLIPAVSTVSVDIGNGKTSAFNLYAGNGYVLIPPSARSEGEYHLVTPDQPIPEPLLDIVNHAITAGEQRAAERMSYVERISNGEGSDLDSQVAEWSQQLSWADVLEPAGWSYTGMVDSCSCPIWTAPGAHSSPKSATTHEHTCSQPHVDVLNPPMHVWTDNPGAEIEAHVKAKGSKTISKLWVWCLLEHGGDMAAALSAAGIEMDPTGTVFAPDSLGATGTSAHDVEITTGVDSVSVNHNAGLEVAGNKAVDSVAKLEPLTPIDKWTPPRRYVDLDAEVIATNGADMWQAWGLTAPSDRDAFLASMPPMGTLHDYDGMPRPTYVVDSFIEHGGLSCVIGASGVGKSAVVLDMAASIATGTRWHGRKTLQCPVMYIAGEGVSGAVDRLRAWQKAHDLEIPDENFLVVGEPVMFGAPTHVWAGIAMQARAYGVGLIIFDTLARMSTGLDENSATDMTQAIRIFDRLRNATGAGVLYVHHTARDTNHGRGSTALLGAVDSEVLVTDTKQDGTLFNETTDGRPADGDGNPLPGYPLCVQVTKQKNGEDDAFNYVCRTSRYDSMVITDLDGNAATPGFAQGGATDIGHTTVEPLEETARRVADYVGQYKSGKKFPTVTDIRSGVKPDNARKGATVATWKNVINLAVDDALSRELIYKHGAGYTTEAPLAEY